MSGLAGQYKATDTTRHLVGFLRWSRSGSSRLREAPVADPALIRRLEVGQAAYIYRGGVTYIQVKRLVAGPAALPAVPAAAATPPETLVLARSASESPLPDIGAFLDEAFGPARARPADRATGERR